MYTANEEHSPFSLVQFPFSLTYSLRPFSGRFHWTWAMIDSHQDLIRFRAFPFVFVSIDHWANAKRHNKWTILIKVLFKYLSICFHRNSIDVLWMRISDENEISLRKILSDFHFFLSSRRSHGSNRWQSHQTWTNWIKTLFHYSSFAPKKIDVCSDVNWTYQREITPTKIFSNNSLFIAENLRR